ncbi:MAG: hypothetical protein M3063_03345 [Actinomycetota bacterium]|nr:hypothetical protein [Actinomycetota bacterium]
MSTKSSEGAKLLKELYIRKYKNLEAVRVPIAGRVVVYGENGVGKTNLLEALALVAGSEFTTRQIARRVVTPEPGAIEVVTALAGRATAMPWTADKEAVRAWWAAIGVDNVPESWQCGIEESSLPDEVKGAVADPSSCAVRYSLVATEGLDDLRAYDGSVGWREEKDVNLPVLRRRFDTTLCVPKSRGDVLRSLDVPLPEVARHFGAETIDPHPGDWVDVLVMPSSSQAPFLVSWLASERSDDDLWADCSRAVDVATAGFRRLTSAAQEVLDLVNWVRLPQSDVRQLPGSSRWRSEIRGLGAVLC